MRPKPSSGKLRRVYCNIDSRDRMSGTPEAYSVKIPGLVNVRGVRIAGLEIPNSLYALPSSQLLSVVDENFDGGFMEVYPLPAGNPTTASFGLGNKNIGLHLPILADGAKLKIYFDPTTYKVSFFADRELTMATASPSLSRVLGLKPNQAYTLIADDYVPVSGELRRNFIEVDGLPLSPSHPSFNYFQAWIQKEQAPDITIEYTYLPFSFTAPLVAILSPSPYIYLNIDQLRSVAQTYTVATNSADDHSLLKLQLNQDTGKYCFFTTYRRTDLLEFLEVTQDILNIDTLSISWTGYKGSPVSFNGAEHSLQLEFLVDDNI